MSHRSLTKYGYILKKNYLSKREIDQIRKDLTVKPVVLPVFKEFQRVKPYPIYLESPLRLYLPRYYGITKYGEPLKVSLAPGNSIQIQDSITLLPHQTTAYQKILDQFQNGNGGVLSLPCGWGKTVLAIKSIAKLQKKTLVIVNKEFLMDQWIDSIEKFTNAKVGILQQNKIQIEGRDIVVGMLHSICQKNYPSEIYDHFGYVIIDECHHIASETFSRALPKIATQYMLGLSATPNRKDGLSRVFYYFLGNLFHKERRQGHNIIKVKQIAMQSDSPFYQNLYLSTGTKNTNGMISQITEFENRNLLILKILRILIAQDRKILLLSSRREHLEHFMELLQKASLRTPQNKFATYGLYYGKQKMNKKQYKKMLTESAKCDIVLGTYQLAKEGLDLPDLNTLILATPETDVEQAVGRILRKYHNQINPLVIDLIDKFGNFPRHGKCREKFYQSEDYAVNNYSMSLSDDDKYNQYEPDLVKYLNNLKSQQTPTNPSQSNKKLPIIFPKSININKAKMDLDTPNSNAPELQPGLCLLDDDN